MAQLKWNDAPPNTYEFGVSNVVLYPDGAPGVAWNGVVSIQETSLEGTYSEIYIDGDCFRNISSGGSYQASLEAYSAPDEFRLCEGDVYIREGITITGQSQIRFGLSYKTQIGPLGYKLHIIYNALCSITKKSSDTSAKDPAISTNSWSINAVPPEGQTTRPSAHFFVESESVNPVSLAYFESIIHGSVGVDPELPDPSTLLSIFS